MRRSCSFRLTVRMLIKEYRIPLPMSVEEYRIAQLYMIQVCQTNLTVVLCRSSTHCCSTWKLASLSRWYGFINLSKAVYHPDRITFHKLLGGLNPVFFFRGKVKRSLKVGTAVSRLWKTSRTLMVQGERDNTLGRYTT